MNEIKILANELLETDWLIDGKNYNLESLGWVFKFNRRKKALGLCDSKTKTISLSKHFVDDNISNKYIWDDTIKHEIAHGIDFEIRKYSDHSDIWKNIAKQVGCDSENYSDKTLVLPNGKYTLKCNHCGLETKTHRIKKNKVACSSCCKEHNRGKFTNKYILNIVVNY